MSETTRIQATQAYAPNRRETQRSNPTDGGPSFAETMAQVEDLHFSNHARSRLRTREIRLEDGGLQRLSEAVQKADARGCQESLVLMDDLAFIVNVKDRMVVTAMDARQRGEGVFTRIDSVVLADEPDTTGTDVKI